MAGYGKTIKRIREEKKLMKKEVYTGIVSRSFAYKFEQDDYDISATKLMKILKNLNVTFDEFLLIHDNYQFKPYSALYLEIATSVNHDIDNLKCIYETNYSSKDLNVKVISSLSYGLYLINKKKDTSHPAVLFLKNYLVSLNHWTIYDIELFQYAVYIFSDQIDYPDLIINQLLPDLERYYHSGYQRPLFEQIIAELYINYSQLLLSSQQIDKARATQELFHSRFTQINSMESKLTMSCSDLLIDFFHIDKRTGAINKYFAIVDFLKENLNEDYNLRNAGDIYITKSADFLNL